MQNEKVLTLTTNMEKSVVKPIVARAGGLVISTESDVEGASIFLKEVHEAIKKVEAQRLEITGPANKALRATNKLFKKITAPLTATKTIIKGKIMAWRQAEQIKVAKEEARRRKIQLSHIKRGHNVEKFVQMDKPAKTIGHAQTRKIWTFKVEDFSKVPDEYKLINSSAIKARIKQTPTPIPGIKVYQEEVLAVR